MDHARYETYLNAFNGRDYTTLGDFYAEDVEFILSLDRGLIYRGRQAIIDLYTHFHQAVEERCEIASFALAGNKLAVEVPTIFRPIPGKRQDVIDLPEGKVLKVITFAWYDIGPDDRFTRIRGASYSRRYEDA
jgi:hypothetical protein